jgi:hypothetical protein
MTLILVLAYPMAGTVRAETWLERSTRKLAESEVGQRLNVNENLATVKRMRNGDMPPQPSDGGCVTRQSQGVIAEFLQRRNRYAELAEYARLVYERDGLQEAVARASLAPAKRQFQDVNVNSSTSLGYMLVEQPGGGGKSEVAIVFEGSTYKNGRAETINKFLHSDLAQLVSKTTPEMYRGAEDVYLKTLKQYPPSAATITLTGHSLGGAMAAYIASKYNARAVTFNPARLSESTIDDAARLRPEILDNGMRGVTNIINISSATDTVHFMGIPGQPTYLPGPSFVFQVSSNDVTGHGMGALSQALGQIALAPPSASVLCANYYGTDASWSALKTNTLLNKK